MSARATAATLAALALTACGGGGAAGEPPTAPSGTVWRAQSNAGGFVAEVRPETDPVPLNEPFAVRVRLFEPDGATPLAHDEAWLDARMPQHGHGMLRHVELESDGEGGYRADGLLLHMIGRWEVHVDVRRGARIERAQFDVEP